MVETSNRYVISPIWDKFLKITELESKEWFQNILLFIEEEYNKDNITICPLKKDIFNIFKLLNPSQIKIVMMFQDPYPQLKKGVPISNGIGLAASYRTHSLKHFDEATGIIGKFDNSMMNLVNQGVFSINKYLTVEAHKPLSHSEYEMSIYGQPLRWDLFSIYVLKRLNEVYKHIVYIFFGGEASQLSSYIDSNSNLIIKTSHPSNRGYKHGLLNSNFAYIANDYLKLTQNIKIKWKLNT